MATPATTTTTTAAEEAAARRARLRRRRFAPTYPNAGDECGPKHSLSS